MAVYSIRLAYDGSRDGWEIASSSPEAALTEVEIELRRQTADKSQSTQYFTLYVIEPLDRMPTVELLGYRPVARRIEVHPAEPPCAAGEHAWIALQSPSDEPEAHQPTEPGERVEIDLCARCGLSCRTVTRAHEHLSRRSWRGRTSITYAPKISVEQAHPTRRRT